MRPGWLAFAFAFALGVTLAFGLGGCGSRSTPEPVADAALAASPDAGESAQVAASSATVRGKVVAAGTAQVGVLVRLGTAGRTRSVRTGADGRFELTGVAPGAYALAASLPARGLGAFQPVDVALDRDPASHAFPDAPIEVLVQLVPSASLAGVVRDEAGRPLAGASVRIEEEERALPLVLEAGADGRFAAADRLKGCAYRVSVRRAGYLADGPRLVRAGAAAIDIRLRRGAILTGLVVDEHGAPVAAAEIAVVSEEEGGEVAPTLSSPGTASEIGEGWSRLEPGGELGVMRGPIPYPMPRALAASSAPSTTGLPRSDGHGVFRVAELPAGRVIVTARHADFADAASVPLQLTAGVSRSVRIELMRGTTLRGRVLDERALGIADVQVTTSDGRTVLSDAGGRFVVEHLLRRTKLSARRAGYLRVVGEVDVAPGQAEATLDLQLERALGRLGGQVVDTRGAAVSGARIVITPQGGEPARATTDAGGRFLVEGMPDGPYRVSIEHPELARLVLPAVEATAEARLVLELGGGIEGELFDGHTGAAPSDAHLELVIGGEHQALPLEGRRFHALALPVGPARLVATARGYPRLERAIDIAAADRPGEVTVRDLRLELELGGRVRGRVRDDRGEPVSGADVGVISADGVAPVRSGADGSFVLGGVPCGRARLRARFDGQTVEEEVEVRANEESRVDLTLPAR